MSLTRRYFLKTAAAAGAAVLAPRFLNASSEVQSASPSEKIGVAVFGAGIRGVEHLNALTKRRDVEILYICDVDSARSEARAGFLERRRGISPKVEQDFRRALDDPRVDAVTIATPNHWHALNAIWAMQAGKDVYCEKPVSHNIWEGRQIVGWARQLNRICASGTQSRSSESLHEAFRYLRSGELGKIRYATSVTYKPRKSIGKLSSPLAIPETVNYDLWCGPAAKVDLYRPQFHYDWHWDFNTGNGDLGNQGIHEIDIARWFLGETGLAPRVMSIGGRLGYEDAGNTPNTQILYYDYPTAPLISEVRGLPRKDLNWRLEGIPERSMDRYRGELRVGVFVQCEKGYLVNPSYTDVTAFDPDGNTLEAWSVKKSDTENSVDRHFANFFKAVRSRNREDLSADILEGHLSSALCHMGNISHRVGSPKPAAEIERAVAGNPLWADAYRRMAEHLAANGIDVTNPKLTLGPWLEMDSARESFVDNAQANALLRREYRKGYEVPDAQANLTKKVYDPVSLRAIP